MNTVPISVEARKVVTMVTVIGEIDLATTPQVQKAVSRYKSRVVLDLRKNSLIQPGSAC